jgi:hypothetical protein
MLDMTNIANMDGGHHMQDGYGILVNTGRSTNVGRYRMEGEDRWDLEEAERIAYRLLAECDLVYVSIGNGGHEFRMWGTAVARESSWKNFTGPDLRWAPWYVDVEINGHRWRYRPVADLRDLAAADELAEYVAELHPHVTRVWVGASDGSEEFEHETDEG